MQGQADHGKNFGFCSKFYEKTIENFWREVLYFKKITLAVV